MRTRAALLAAIAILYGISIPWYRASGGVPARILGLPDWVAVALGCYVAAAVLSAVAWLHTDVRDEEPGAPDDE
jgi:hypothetical protein